MGPRTVVLLRETDHQLSTLLTGDMVPPWNDQHGTRGGSKQVPLSLQNDTPLPELVMLH